MQGKLSQKEAKEFLKNNIYGHLGCHASGKTYVVPISYAYNGKNIYCHTHEGMKIDMMRENSSVCFQVQAIDSLANWKSVIIQGTFRELITLERKKGIKALIERHVPAVVTETVKISPDWPFTDTEHIEIPGIIFSISVDDISGRFETIESQSK